MSEEMEANMARERVALALHGGAGAKPGRDYNRQIAHMREQVEIARDDLYAGASALDVVTKVVAALEISGLYVAGRGASPNVEGKYELDASIMDGASARAGAVAVLTGIQSPVAAARAVMEQTPHVLLAGEGARHFAKMQRLPEIQDPETWFTRAEAETETRAGLSHGTVGCVALDAQGRMAAATSTGGVFGKLPGRVGDTPLIGAGVWADAQVGVSCTGLGEYFIRTAAAAQLAFRIRLAGETLDAAAQAVLDDIGRLGGNGGLIALDRAGRIVMPFNSQGMKRAALHPDGRIEADAF